jgi:hypothetical protein
MDPIAIQRVVVAEKRLREEKAALRRGERIVPSNLAPGMSENSWWTSQRTVPAVAHGPSTERRAHGLSTTRRLALALGSLGAATLMIAQLVR